MSTENKHTPGEWKHRREAENLFLIMEERTFLGHDGFYIAQVFGGLEPGELEANAELIASAPALKELLQRVVELGISADHGKNTHKLNAIIRDFREILNPSSCMLSTT